AVTYQQRYRRLQQTFNRVRMELLLAQVRERDLRQEVQQLQNNDEANNILLWDFRVECVRLRNCLHEAEERIRLFESE
ncbi:18245_t:CDS:1, partial [Funneliformis geosporum]